MPDATPVNPFKNAVSSRWLWGVWFATTFLAGRLEWLRFESALDTQAGPVAWLMFWDMETTLPFLMLMVFPVLALVFRRSRTRRDVPREQKAASTGFTICASSILFCISMLCSYRIGAEVIPIRTQQGTSDVAFADLPPAYHDEYSYLLQARTFLDGRLAYPGMSVRPDLFHQMHVLNEHRTISRYFPWTGAWIAPFEAMGRPVLGHWLAGALSTVFFYLALLQVASRRAAFVGGLLIAVSPGIAVFSNLLLAHHPTMLALSVFTCCFFRMMSTQELRYAFVAGTGLSLAMLGRPMTAAGFAFPFGVWLLFAMFAQRRLVRLIPGFAIPLIVGFIVLGVCNYAATGSASRTAYQEYTDVYTPSHRYGFNNAVNSNAIDTSKILTAYDSWATNLTPSIAAKNVWNRVFYSAQWSLAVFPLLFGVLMAIPALFRSGVADADAATKWGLRLIALSVVSLHIAHIPYWFDGIMHWHYVFETAPLLLLLAGAGFVNAAASIQRYSSGKIAVAWIVAFVAVGLLPGWVALPACDDTSKVSAAISELAFSRTRFHHFRQIVEADSFAKPALVLVDERQSDPQLSYILNPPDLDSEVLICRRPETDEEIAELAASFPNRVLYHFHPDTLIFEQVSIPTTPAQ